MNFTEAERAELARWIANLKVEAGQIAEYLAKSPPEGAPGARKRLPATTKRFRAIVLRVAILERVAVL